MNAKHLWSGGAGSNPDQPLATDGLLFHSSLLKDGLKCPKEKVSNRRSMRIGAPRRIERSVFLQVFVWVKLWQRSDEKEEKGEVEGFRGLAIKTHNEAVNWEELDAVVNHLTWGNSLLNCQMMLVREGEGICKKWRQNHVKMTKSLNELFSLFWKV